MKNQMFKAILALGIIALAIPNSAVAKAKKKAKITMQNAKPTPTPSPRVPGYAIIELENGGRDKLHVAEGESRAILPNIMANDVDFITVIGANTIVTVYEAPNFRGHSLTLSCGNYELLQQPRNDIESIQVRNAKTPVSECQGKEGQPVQYKSWDR
jgi:hypothetical protein